MKHGNQTVIIIPIYNPDHKFLELLQMLKKQDFLAFDIYIIQTGSSHLKYEKYLEGFKYTIRYIKPSEFNHGGTRRKAALECKDYEFLIYMTQDAVPKDEFSISNLLQCFSNPEIGCAFGRQIPNKDANLLAAFARTFNYPDKSYVMGMDDIKKYGIKASFLSDTFAAYRQQALMAVGGFPEDVILGEDAVVASRMILLGWKKAYCADAEVYHSHNYSMIQEFRRYFDTGVFHGRNPWIRNEFGRAEGEGKKYIYNEFRYIYKRNKLLQLPKALLIDACKYIAFNLGKKEKWIPLTLKKRITMTKRYW